MTKSKDKTDKQPSELSLLLSDFEYSLIILVFGFSRWVELCMAATNYRGLNMVDILVLHATNHRAQNRKISEICMVLNIDETHLVSYSLKKLQAAGLVSYTSKGRERHYSSTDLGDQACDEYREIREKYLVRGLASINKDGNGLDNITNVLSTMCGLYDQAGRLATADAISRPNVPPMHTKK